MSTTAPHTEATDHEASFVARHQRGVRRWLAMLGCDVPSAEEHCQDALLAALHHGVHALPTADAWRWLRTASKRFFWQRLRAERRRPPARSLEELEGIWQAAGGDRDGGDEALAALADCQSALPVRERELIVLRYRDGQGRAAIARHLALSDAGVKQALRRARARLRACIERKLATNRP